MIILRNLNSNPFLSPSFASPSFAYHWVVPDKEETNTNADNEKDNSEATSQVTSKANNTNKPSAHWYSRTHGDFELHQHQKDDDYFLLTTDLPGVKLADLKVEFRDSALHIQAKRQGQAQQYITRHLALEEDVIDVPNLSATLEDGILTVKVPAKKEKEDQPTDDCNNTLPVTYQAPPAVDGSEDLNMEIDVPGIKANDLKVVCNKKSAMLHIVGERRNASGPTKMTKSLYQLNTHAVDVTKLDAYLADGVLTIRAPAKVHPTKIVAVNGHLPAAVTSDDSTTKQLEEEEGGKTADEKYEKDTPNKE
ncbi:expressed unknown protein [Seminavis robusta]|uniref:SHSP domain-containing protein n=1 Tax=Seminavis robusta TaxID=568900 RepID=A0A9N8HJD6_9STRA|nr:expressed unknown protein [Seminavis robusta]|eukprot:Sro546_g164030.1 n/a (307) ;mRNA; r:19310-20230